MIYQMKKEMYNQIANQFTTKELREKGLTIEGAMLEYVNEQFTHSPNTIATPPSGGFHVVGKVNYITKIITV